MLCPVRLLTLCVAVSRRVTAAALEKLCTGAGAETTRSALVLQVDGLHFNFVARRKKHLVAAALRDGACHDLPLSSAAPTSPFRRTSVPSGKDSEDMQTPRKKSSKAMLAINERENVNQFAMHLATCPVGPPFANGTL